MPNKSKQPNPDELMKKAAAMANGLRLWDYRKVMWVLRDKGLTLRAIAAWMTKELGVAVTHTQVYRILKQDTAAGPDDQEPTPEQIEDSAEERRALLAAELDELRKLEENDK